MTREYELIKELVERGTSLEDINEMYEAAKQEKEKRAREASIEKARNELIRIAENYIKEIVPESNFSKEELKNEILMMEKIIKTEKKKMDFNKKNADFLNDYIKKMGW